MATQLELLFDRAIKAAAPAPASRAPRTGTFWKTLAARKADVVKHEGYMGKNLGRTEMFYHQSGAPAGGWKSATSSSDPSFLDELEAVVASYNAKYLRTRTKLSTSLSEAELSNIVQGIMSKRRDLEREQARQAEEKKVRIRGLGTVPNPREIRLDRHDVTHKVRSQFGGKGATQSTPLDAKWLVSHFGKESLEVNVIVWTNEQSPSDRQLNKVFPFSELKAAQLYAQKLIVAGQAIGVTVLIHFHTYDHKLGSLDDQLESWHYKRVEYPHHER